MMIRYASYFVAALLPLLLFRWFAPASIGEIDFWLLWLLAMVLVSLAMMFFNISSTWNLALGYLGVLVFSIFTAVDVNRIKQNITAVALTEDESVLERVELIGALSLYLDFINLFLSFMRIFGRK